MNLQLIRQTYNDHCTKGSLYIDGRLECFTLEPPRTDSSELNVTNRTCIFPGTYAIAKAMSPKREYMVLLLLDVPGRSEIEIHIGNYPRDTEGCILVGAQYSVGDQIGESTVAFKGLMSQVDAALANREQIQITISDLFADSETPTALL